MIWKDVIGYEQHYEVSETGTIRRKPSKVIRGSHTLFVPGKVIEPRDNGMGYFRVKLTVNNKPKRVMVHRIIAEAFIPNPANKRTVNHIDGNKKNNQINNLEWCTQSENCLHTFRTGLRVFTEEYRKCRREILKDAPRGEHGKLVKRSA